MSRPDAKPYWLQFGREFVGTGVEWGIHSSYASLDEGVKNAEIIERYQKYGKDRLRLVDLMTRRIVWPAHMVDETAKPIDLPIYVIERLMMTPSKKRAWGGWRSGMTNMGEALKTLKATAAEDPYDIDDYATAFRLVDIRDDTVIHELPLGGDPKAPARMLSIAAKLREAAKLYEQAAKLTVIPRMRREMKAEEVFEAARELRTYV